MLIKFFRMPALSGQQGRQLLQRIKGEVSEDAISLQTERGYYIDTERSLTAEETGKLKWLLAETFEPEAFDDVSFLYGGNCYGSAFFEVGPRPSRVTPWSSNAVSIFQACGISSVKRIEVARRYELTLKPEAVLTEEQRQRICAMIHDRMTEMPYLRGLETFDLGLKPELVRIVPLIEKGKSVLEELNQEMGLGMDEWDINYYYDLFVNIKRDPTDVELFQLAQANSEHSRHWFFKGKLVIDGLEMPQSLMDIVKTPWTVCPGNSIIAFNDNASAILGYNILTIVPASGVMSSPFRKTAITSHIVFTAETHNFPTGVSPLPGAETGTGGRQRDNSDTGRGALIVAGTAAYCVGNLLIPGYNLPWEDERFVYPLNLASPLQIEIEASNGASDYGNKFGEPVIIGFTRSFGLRLPNGERREWLKPIMFTGGIGQIDGRHIKKGQPEKGMWLVKMGGPAYRIGVGGGAASSMTQGQNVTDLDFSAVQRGDAEMAKKTYNVIRACCEMGENNPIISIHDQGAGGRCNVETEIVNPAGARIEVRSVWIGDQSLSALEIWGAEYQEQHALLIWPERLSEFQQICVRETVVWAVVGQITGDGFLVLHDEQDGSNPVDLELTNILGKLPQKTFSDRRLPKKLKPLSLPQGLTVREALERVLRLLSVGSKRFLTTKVDRSVTGLIAQQQCVGPLQLTVADCAVIAQSHFGLTGAVTSIGEQPITGLINPSAMARMAVGEALTNLAGVKIPRLADIKCSANWMCPAKFPGEAAVMYDAACAMRDIMLDLGIAVDGGKDSVSMATKVTDASGNTELVKSPGALVISAYASCPDITKKVTPDIKRAGESKLLYIDLGWGRYRLGGSALAQVYGQIGDDSPDVSTLVLRHGLEAVQELVDRGLVLAYHDRSDGGLITTLLEMAFAGNCGLSINLDGSRETDPIRLLFSQELGMVIEFLPENEAIIKEVLERHKIRITSTVIGCTTKQEQIVIAKAGQTVLDEEMMRLRAIWAETSHQLDLLQANPECVEEERIFNYCRSGPKYHLTFTPEPTSLSLMNASAKPRVAIVREEGSNGDREMASAFFMAGFEPWDVTMTDLLAGRVNLCLFRGIAFVGGFSYADVLDAGKGWAGVIRFNPALSQQFSEFYNRPDTFSLGVCNGCQLMALLGWVPWQGIIDVAQPRFIRNESERFESRWVTVKILPSPAIILQGMEGSVLGIWSAHGEGRMHFPDPAIENVVLADGLAPIRFVNDVGQPTEAYPFNPNGSPYGISALCSPDGRHLAVMPHPERTFLPWQWPWMPLGWTKELKASPWLKLFQNARAWCE